MGQLLPKCYSHLEDCSTRATTERAIFKLITLSKEMHMRSNSKQMKQLKDPTQLACAWILFFRGEFFWFFFSVYFLWTLAKEVFFGSTSSPAQDGMWEAVLFLRCKTNQTHIPRLKLKKTKDFNHEYGRYFITFKHSGLGQRIKNVRILWRNDRTHALEFPSLFRSFFSSLPHLS